MKATPIIRKDSTISEHYLWIDILNIVACICVILLHVSNRPLVFYDRVSVPFYWAAFTHSVALWPVPVFLMMSGSNLIGNHRGGVKRFYKRRLTRTGIPFIAWSIIYLIAFQPNMTWKELITTFINGHFNYHMWFFIPLFSFYLCIPFLNKMTVSINKQLMFIYLDLVLVFISIVPYIFAIMSIKYLDYSLFNLAENLQCYPILGYFIGKKEFLHNERKRLYFFASVICLFNFGMICWAIPNGIDRSIIISYTSPHCFIMSIAVFLFFKNTNWECVIKKLNISSSHIKHVASCSLGIYLIHGGIRHISEKYDFVITNPYYGTLLLYIISLLFILLMKRIPYIKNIVP